MTIDQFVAYALAVTVLTIFALTIVDLEDQE